MWVRLLMALSVKAKAPMLAPICPDAFPVLYSCFATVRCLGVLSGGDNLNQLKAVLTKWLLKA